MMKGRQFFTISALASPPLHFKISQSSSLLEYNDYTWTPIPTPGVFPSMNMHAYSSEGTY